MIKATIKTRSGLKVNITGTTFITDGVPGTFGIYNYRFKLKDLIPGDDIHADAVYKGGAIIRAHEVFETGTGSDGGGYIGCQGFSRAAWCALRKAAKAARAKKGTKKK